MDYHFSYQQNSNPRRSLWMERFSFFLGIMALTGLCLVTPSLIGGSLAIVFAVLSKGGENTMTPRAMIGMTLGIISLSIVAFLFVCTIFMLISYYGGISNIPLDYEQILEDMNTLTNSYMNQVLTPAA